jgi:hypothetical protein
MAVFSQRYLSPSTQHVSGSLYGLSPTVVGVLDAVGVLQDRF